ncbi:hypothetical protein [Bacillus thuringiensis]|uniref:hypothetical protein n=1 Tax=Bacillus thuringiensis TaxID=1428 RepID=UPI002AB4C844|nr:hypothetical protein [Bacillus thuringiensis]MDY7965610.1 hypothetical protein [Bacillus thuringiensis]
MKDLKSITVTRGKKSLEIYNPTTYPLIGMGTQGAVFKLTEDKCVKIYLDPVQAKMEGKILKAGQHLPFMPAVYDTGSNYIIMEYFNAPTLKEYLKDCMYMPGSIVEKLLNILKKLNQTKLNMIDASLHNIFVVDNEEFKLVGYENSFKKKHPVPLKLLRDLKEILLKDSFLAQVKRLEPDTFTEWNKYLNQKNWDFRNIAVLHGGRGNSVILDSAFTQTLIGKGHQGAVYRVSEEQCVKIYGKIEHANHEKNVLLASQHLSFIPKVFETGPNFILMEYLSGPDLNTFLKKQSVLSEDITRQLLYILKKMKKSGFKKIDAPLRHIIITNNGFKLVDHVYSFSQEQKIPLELFKNLGEKNFLDSFLEQVKAIDPKTYIKWKKGKIEFPY